jgi:hypothetical protein
MGGRFPLESVAALVRNTQPEAVRQAYQSYKKWFEQVKRLGLAKAREMKIEPLKDTKVHWY